MAVNKNSFKGARQRQAAFGERIDRLAGFSNSNKFSRDGGAFAVDGSAAAVYILREVKLVGADDFGGDIVENFVDTKMTILLTGTHLTPAIATIQALRRKAAKVRLVYVGREHTGVAESVEREEIDRVGAEFATIESGKFHRWSTFRILPEMLKIPRGIWEGIALVRRYKPDVVVSFGGYISVPMVLAGKISGAKIVIHEQTTKWGLANRLLRRMADVTAVGWKKMVESGEIWTGNPIRDEIISIKDTPWRTPRSILSKKPVLYITGGNQGARAIDKVVSAILPDLVDKFEVFHQTKSEFNFKHPRYHPCRWFSTPVHAAILSRTAVSVSRSGANTVTELAYLGIPSILVPLPYSAGNEQVKNARMLAATGLAKIIQQPNLTAKLLLKEILAVVGRPEKFWTQARGKAGRLVKSNSAEEFADITITPRGRKEL